ncbi:Crp/Fnr family transcriptional regulator [Nonomuraea sp. NPDC059007]|uniref:Crp/Fnr family transcriptional regulator n=1 Tax=Nonomuraea sp. NPDC059007 TaxID=3346692 RepID=UPI0036AACE27
MPVDPARDEYRCRWPSGTLMAALDEETRDALVTLGDLQVHGPGVVLLRQGDTQADHVLLLRSTRRGTSACVKVTATLGNGVDTMLGIRVSGDLVGEMAVMRSIPRSATVTTCTQTAVYRIWAGRFQAFLEQRPAMWAALTTMIANRLDWANQRRLDFTGYEVYERVVRVLAELAARHGVQAEEGLDVGVSLSHEEIGQLVGAREAAASKALRTLKSRGLIEIGYRRVVVRDLAALRAVLTG